VEDLTAAGDLGHEIPFGHMVATSRQMRVVPYRGDKSIGQALLPVRGLQPDRCAGLARNRDAIELVRSDLVVSKVSASPHTQIRAMRRNCE
jgi:hypothetical protein